jgi:hypothetical protein
MSFTRQPLLKPEVEEQLKDELSQLWLMGMTGKNIAQDLQFGVKGTDYEKLKPHYVYYYRQKFAEKNPDLFPPRNEPPFAKDESRYKHPPEELGIMEPEEFIETLDEKLPPIDSFYAKRARSFLILLFYTPLRSSEIYERTIDDFEITKTKITIHLLRKKKRHKPTDKDEPIDVPRAFPLVDEVVDWLEGEEWKRKKVNRKGEVTFNLRPWAISHDTARNYVKEVFENAYPHWFRFNFLTTEANYPETTIAELKSKSRLTLSALEKYVMAPKVVERKLDRRRIKRFKDKGLIK